MQNSTSDMQKPVLTNRRIFLQIGSITLALIALGSCNSPALAAIKAATNTNEEDIVFFDLSCFLTNRSDLNPALAKRARLLLLKIDKDFDNKIAEISSEIEKSKAPNIDIFAFTARTFSSDIQDAIMAIISSWYLGVTPALNGNSPGFITFTDALMYQPTSDATNPPTYALGGLNFWEEPPASVIVPPMQKHIREWGQKSPQGVGQIEGALPDGTLLRRPLGLDLPLTPDGNAPGTE